MGGSTFPLGFQWQTQEPFLFCVHHNDFYPRGEADWGPPRNLLAGRDIGQDFAVKDGFRMYHGEIVPGFPVHPHRGFETITIVRKGYVDHADSLGAAGRYGEGDVQWMTAGRGVQHSEMFPLLRADADNRLELFQIWLNLPRKSKMAEPHFKMLWNEKIPRIQEPGGALVTLISGSYGGLSALPPPPSSWAFEPSNGVRILLVRIPKQQVWNLPATSFGSSKQASENSLSSDVRRTVYFFSGTELGFKEETNPDFSASFRSPTGAILRADQSYCFKATVEDCEILLLEARAIGEPVVQHGPFVMNSREEILQTFQDYQKTQFGGWPWPRPDMVHGPVIERFAKYPDGKVERP